MKRPSSRKVNQLRPITIEVGASINAEGSCLIKQGNTHILCTASIDEKVPPFLRGQGKGWVTAEYGLLPRSTNTRVKREATQGKQAGRTLEIQRLIGRSLRAVVDENLLGERQIIIDCDVINADGGTRTAAITGGYVALYLAVQHLMKTRRLHKNPIIAQTAAISCGIRNGSAILDLDYIEDSDAAVDANFVFTNEGKLIEIQGTAEKEPFSSEQLLEMLELAKAASSELFQIQNAAILSTSDLFSGK